MTGSWTDNLRHKLFGDKRDQQTALREAGFADEAAAAAWARDLVGTPLPSEVELLKRIRSARPDLTLATVAYIARQTTARHG